MAERKFLTSEQAGPLLAKIRNSLPAEYAGGYHQWLATDEDTEAFGMVRKGGLASVDLMTACLFTWERESTYQPASRSQGGGKAWLSLP